MWATFKKFIIHVSVFLLKIPEIRNRLEKLYDGQWEAIALKQMKECFTLDESQMKEQAQR